MEKFVWENEYSVGVKEIDEQHQHFFELANEILDLVNKENPARKEVFSAIEKLGNYAFYHFGTEESYFDKFNYPETTEHVAVHNEYRKSVENYMNEIRAEGTDVFKTALEIALYSNNWLATHILKMDKKYTKYFLNE